jgi:uncharacterized protein YjiS (DUF1127 family)
MAATTTLTAHGVHSPAGFDLWTHLAQAFKQLETWLVRQRRYQVTITQLSALNDQMLADIGLERGDIRAVAHKLVDARTV